MTESRSEVLARLPRSTSVWSPIWAATSAVTLAFAVAVVARTGVLEASVRTLERR